MTTAETLQDLIYSIHRESVNTEGIHRSVSAALSACALMLIDAAYEDGIELDSSACVFAAFGVFDDSE